MLSVEELRQAGAAMALYPLSAFRAMSRAAETVYGANDLDPAAAFAIPPSALVALATDASLDVDLDG